MVTRTYIDKNNTIIKDTTINTGRNPIAELYYGGSETATNYTRHLLYFDIDTLQTQYTNGELGNLSNVTHTLKMCNSSFFDRDLQAQKLLDDKQRTSSFDLVLFRINKSWDEGCGYDYQRLFTIQDDDNITFVESASNWLNATTLDTWDEPGVYSGSPSAITITTQHFDKGNENIEMDITDEVNSLITGGTTNYGYGVAFERDLEILIKNPSQFVGFFTRHTQTYYEPFLETIYEDAIIDDRKNFYRGKTNKLYLYSNLGGEPTNLDNNPSVKIYDEDGVLFSSVTTAQTVHVTTGIYYAEIFVPITQEDGVLFTDTWSDINIDTISRPDVDLEFEIKDDTDYYKIGDNESLPIEYALSLSGVKRDEKIKRGDKRKVFVSARIPFTINQSEVIDGLQYRLWVREGNTQVNVIEWQDVNRAYLKNYFIVDTSWMIPNEYHIDIKLTSNMQVKTLTDAIKFNIVNQIAELH
jgi:hypothetical protein